MSQTATISLPLAIQGPDGIWTKEVELEEMTGVEEDILADTRRVKQAQKGKKKGDPVKHPSSRISEVLSRCTRRIGACTRPAGSDRRSLPDFFLKSWEQAFTNDRGFALIRLRQLSLGDKYSFTIECPECGAELKRSVDLGGLEVNELPIADLSKNGGIFEATLKSGKVAAWKILRGVDEALITEIVKSQGGEIATALLTARITTIGGALPTSTMIQNLTSRERAELRSLFDKSEGGIDTELVIECDEEGCGHTWKEHVSPLSPDFFFPSETD